MRRIAAIVVLIVCVFAGVALTSEVTVEQAAEPPSTEPPSPPAVPPPATPEATVPAPRIPPTLPASDRAEISPAVIETSDLRAGALAVAPLPFDPADEDPGWHERKGQAALSLVPFDVARTGFRIKFMAARAGYRGGTFPYEKLIEIYVRPELTVEQIAWDIAHEIGHAYDWVFNTPGERDLFKQARGYGSKPGWLACSGCNDFSTPAGDFAETFAYWAMNATQPFRGQIVGAPDAAQLDLLTPILSQ